MAIRPGQTKRSILLAGLVALTVGLVNKSWADGLAFHEPSDRFELVPENQQEAFLKHENGIQTMVLAVGLHEAGSSELVWLFPLPAKPADIQVDIVDELPSVRGMSIAEKARDALKEAAVMAAITSVFSPLGVLASQLTMKGNRSLSLEQAVDVYQHIEKHGITTEVVTAERAEALQLYLKTKGFTLSKAALPVLDEYLGRNFSFVVSWIQPDASEAQPRRSQKQRGVWVKFPTETAFYPLRPTSVYGETTIPTVVRVFDLVEPSMPKDVKKYVKTEYLRNSTVLTAPFSTPGRAELRFTSPAVSPHYTRVEISAPSRLFTSDLFFQPRRSPVLSFAVFAKDHVFYLAMLMALMSSFVCSIFWARVLFGRILNFKRTLALGLYSLLNCLWLPLFVMEVNYIRLEEDPEPLRGLIQDLWARYNGRQRVTYALLLMIVPLIILILLAALASNLIHGNNNWGLVGFFTIALLVVLGVMAWFRRVRLEDRAAFEELSAKGYSDWTLDRHDRRKRIFLGLFFLSYIFLILGSTLVLRAIVDF